MPLKSTAIFSSGVSQGSEKRGPDRYHVSPLTYEVKNIQHCGVKALCKWSSAIVSKIPSVSILHNLFFRGLKSL